MDNSNQPTSDGEASKEDRSAVFIELYSQYSMRLHYYLMALLSNQSDASDVLQETSLVLWKKFGEFEIGTNFYAWACTTARFQALKFRQRKLRGDKMLGVTALDKISEDATTDDRSYELPIEALELCLEKLNDSDRKLVRNRYEPNASVKDIAQQLDTTANLVSKSLYRIRKALLACIERRLSLENH